MRSPSLLEELMRQHPGMDEREARGRIMRGDVLLGTTRVTKPGTRVRTGEPIRLTPAAQFASRAGEKLDGALGRLRVVVEDKVIVDAGSGAGGFTDCLLSRGASLVYCVDVGRNQLAWRLRRDPRVRIMEGTNVMALGAASFERRPHGAVCDLSFRSIVAAASHLVSLVAEGWLLALVKPQFEWRKPDASFRGVVKDARDLLGILVTLLGELRREGLVVRAVCPSRLPGHKGNREFFFLLAKAGTGGTAVDRAGLEAAVCEGGP